MARNPQHKYVSLFFDHDARRGPSDLADVAGDNGVCSATASGKLTEAIAYSRLCMRQVLSSLLSTLSVCSIVLRRGAAQHYYLHVHSRGPKTAWHAYDINMDIHLHLELSSKRAEALWCCSKHSSYSRSTQILPAWSPGALSWGRDGKRARSRLVAPKPSRPSSDIPCHPRIAAATEGSCLSPN